MYESFNLKKLDVLSWITIFFIVLYESLKESALNLSINKALLILPFLSFGIQLLKKLYVSKLKSKTMKSMLFLLFVITCIVIQFVSNRDIRLLISILGIYSAIWIDESKVISSVLFAKVIAIVLVVISGGYRHINLFAAHSGMVLLLYMCKYKDKFDVRKLVAILLCYGVICRITMSGSFIIGLGFAIVLEVMMLIIPKLTHKILSCKLVCVFFPICFFSNLLLVMCYGTYHLPGILDQLSMPIKRQIYQITQELDSFFTGRLSLANYSLKEFGYSWLGGNIADYQNFNYKGHYFNLDSGMMWLLQGSGLLITAIFIVTMTLVMLSFIKKKEYQYSIALMTISLWGVNEDIIRSVGFNFMILFIGKAIVDTFKKDENEYNRI